MNNFSKLLLIFLLPSLSLKAQNKNDFNWVLGYRSTVIDPQFGANQLDFNSGNVAVSGYPFLARMDSHSIMSDENGMLMYYTDGCRIYNAQNQIIVNGSQINQGYMYNYYCGEGGYLVYNGLLSLPFPGQNGQYVLFHIRKFPSVSHNELLYSIIDMNENNGQGKVISKNNVLVADTFAQVISAVRHANGRDWWLTVSKDMSSEFLFYRLSPAGIEGPFHQDLLHSQYDTAQYTLSAYCRFSPDGKYMLKIMEGWPGEITLYNFDRCAGTLYNPRQIAVPQDTIWATWAAFSPSSKYLYITNEVTHLYQYNLDTPYPNASITQIAEYAGEYDPQTGFPTGFFAMALAPDGKIYMTTATSAKTMHVINEPDLPGVSCNFERLKVQLPHYNLFYAPNLPDFRLYAEENTVCDSLGVIPPIVSYWRDEPSKTLGALGRKFRDLSYHKPVSWHWDFDDGTVSDAASPAHLFPAPGQYEVCLTVCNAFGECDTTCNTVNIGQTTATETPEGVSLDDMIWIYPNPADQYAVISYSGEKEVELILADALGNVVTKRMLSPHSEQELDTSQLPPGLYCWSLLSPSFKARGGILQVIH